MFSYGLDASSRRPIERALKSVVRYVYGLQRLESAAPYVDRFLGCSFDSYFKLKSLSLIFKVIRTGVPGYLREAFQVMRSPRATGLVVPRHGTGLGKTLFVGGVIDWNGLPAALRSDSSLSRFKSGCLKFFQSS